ncbi:MAG: ABC transporter ATP-binding protein [Bacteroidales bacterium]|nr:ABC transporter ATP-binding protein [Bacteroidales bacterium]
MKPMLRILAYLKYFPAQITGNVLFNLLHILFSVGSYVMIIPFVELLFGMNGAPATEPSFGLGQQELVDWGMWHLYQYQAHHGPLQCLLIIAGAYVACSLLSNLFRYLAQVFLGALRTGLIERLRNDIYHKVTILPVSFFSSKRRGDLMSRMSNDLADLEWCVGVLQSLVKEPINVLVFGFLLVFISWRLFILFLVVLPVGVWLIALIGRKLKHSSRRGQNELGGLNAILEETLAGLKAVKSFGREDDLERRYAEANDSYTRTMIKVARHRELSSPLSEILGTLALVFILVVGGWQVFDGSIQPSVFIFFVIIFARIIPPIQAIVRSYNTLLKSSASAERFLEVLDADEVITEKPDATVLPGFNDKIEFKNISFSYREKPDNPESPEASLVLRNISLTIPKGQTVAVVGPSGAGKTTLVDLLPRFYDCTAGSIVIDGHDIRDLNINSLRRQFGLVSQNCILFNDTVANNIAFGSTDYTREQIREAARVAHADEFIDQLPQGYDTAIGDRGLNLSGGQRQRLSIARAVLRDTPILILDEATSALDSESEHAVQQGLDALMQGRTSIVIAHRLSTIKDADLIVVLDKGQIVEQGTHEQLLALGGLYKKLVDMQSFA